MELLCERFRHDQQRSSKDASPPRSHVNQSPGSVKSQFAPVGWGRTTYVYCAHGLHGQQLLSGSAGSSPDSSRRASAKRRCPGWSVAHTSLSPLPAATSTVVVAGTVVGAALTHMVQLAADGGFSAIPWNLIIWAVPGAVLGAVLGTGLQGKLSPRVTRWFFSGLFLTIGVTFLLASQSLRATTAESAYSPAALTWPGSRAGPDRL